MKKEPIKVCVVNQTENAYHIKFPNLEIPVKVNEQLYLKMLHRPDYQFRSTSSAARTSYSA